MPRNTFTALEPVTLPMEASAYWSWIAATLLAKVSGQTKERGHWVFSVDNSWKVLGNNNQKCSISLVCWCDRWRSSLGATSSALKPLIAEVSVIDHMAMCNSLMRNMWTCCWLMGITLDTKVPSSCTCAAVSLVCRAVRHLSTQNCWGTAKRTWEIINLPSGLYWPKSTINLTWLNKCPFGLDLATKV